MDIQTTLNNATNVLKDHKIKSPNLDSEILLSKVINKGRKYVILNGKENLKTEYLNSFNNLIERRKKGEPIAYLINKKEFWKNEFYVDTNVLIPRPDTEIIVDHVLRVSMKNSQLNILDIGIGSGCILLSLLKERPNFYGTGIDISKKSINVCRYNAKMQDARERFNTTMQQQIDQSNALWRRTINTSNTAEQNNANRINAANILGITAASQAKPIAVSFYFT